MDEFSPFTRGLLREKFGEGNIERSLARLKTAQERLINFRTEEERAIPRMMTREELAAAVKRYYGRAASLMREVERDLLRMDQAKRLMKDRPALEPTTPTVVVAGYPNVGKSSFVGRITTADPKVAAYPFTTLAVAVGHAPLGPMGTAQVVDTPGLMDRNKTHAAEREALLALEAGGKVVLYLLDPTGSCGWPLADQEALLERLKARFPDRVFIEVENKADVLKTSTTRPKISCRTGDGIDEVVALLKKALESTSPDLPPLPALRDEMA